MKFNHIFAFLSLASHCLAMSSTVFNGVETGFFLDSDQDLAEYNCGADTPSDPLMGFLDMLEPIKLMLGKNESEKLIVAAFESVKPMLTRFDLVLQTRSF